MIKRGKLVDVKVFGQHGVLMYGGDDGDESSGALDIRFHDSSTQDVYVPCFQFENLSKAGPESLDAFVDGCRGACECGRSFDIKRE